MDKLEQERKPKVAGCKLQWKKKRKARKKLIIQEVRKQMEFYLGDVNLSKDDFFRNIINDKGCLPIETILKCNRIRKFTSNAGDVIKAAEKSELLSVTEDGCNIRRNTPFNPVEQDDSKVIFVSNLPSHVNIDFVKSVFRSYGNVTYVSIPRFKHNKKIKGFAFVEFEDRDSANAALQAFKSANSIFSTSFHECNEMAHSSHAVMLHDKASSCNSPPPLKKYKISKKTNDTPNDSVLPTCLHECDEMAFSSHAVTSHDKVQSCDSPLPLEKLKISKKLNDMPNDSALLTSLQECDEMANSSHAVTLHDKAQSCDSPPPFKKLKISKNTNDTPNDSIWPTSLHECDEMARSSHAVLLHDNADSCDSPPPLKKLKISKNMNDTPNDSILTTSLHECDEMARSSHTVTSHDNANRCNSPPPLRKLKISKNTNDTPNDSIFPASLHECDEMARSSHAVLLHDNADSCDSPPPLEKFKISKKTNDKPNDSVLPTSLQECDEMTHSSHAVTSYDKANSCDSPPPLRKFKISKKTIDTLKDSVLPMNLHECDEMAHSSHAVTSHDNANRCNFPPPLRKLKISKNTNFTSHGKAQSSKKVTFSKNTNDVPRNAREISGKVSPVFGKSKRVRNAGKNIAKRKKQKAVATHGMRIMSKVDWKKSRDLYLNNSRTHASIVKKKLQASKDDSSIVQPEVQKKECVKFVPGVIIKLDLVEPITDVKKFKYRAQRFNQFDYIDAEKNGKEAYLRCKNARIAKEVAIGDFWPMAGHKEVLQGIEESLYWEKIMKDRLEKRSKSKKIPRTVIRGRDKIENKIQNIIASRLPTI